MPRTKRTPGTRTRRAGFTLIELMMVIAILAILLALAVPVYQDYVARSRASECLGAAQPAKLAISEVAMVTSELPDDATAAGIDTSGFGTEYCDTLGIGTDGVITVQADETEIGGSALGETLEIRLTPRMSAGSVAWSCSHGSSTATRLLPPECRPAS